MWVWVCGRRIGLAHPSSLESNTGLETDTERKEEEGGMERGCSKFRLFYPTRTFHTKHKTLSELRISKCELVEPRVGCRLLSSSLLLLLLLFAVVHDGGQ